MAWPQQPVIYEINTWVWLHELGRKYGREVTLANVPPSEWDALAKLGIDGVWFMGVWERSPAGRKISATKPDLVAEYHRILPDFMDLDVCGSPYCIHDYKVDVRLGGPPGLALSRKELAARELCLLLDFVPNHVAPDHPWTKQHPDYFVRGTEEDWNRAREEFFKASENVFIANGRDPYFAPWTDTAQVNAFSPGLRQAATQTVDSIAEQCDGVRCDMAMLMLNQVFSKTWGRRAGAAPATEYWTDLISSIRSKHPRFVFIAEAYWDLESELISRGFDYCYDKRLYDRMVHENADSIRAHLGADLGYQKHLIRFLENHDEPRAASVFSSARERAAAVALMTLPGAKLLHEGQFEGRKVHVSVHLGRRPDEPADGGLLQFYQHLLPAAKEADLRNGQWQLRAVSGWPDNQSCHNLLAWTWNTGRRTFVIVINFSDQPSQGMVQLPSAELRDRQWNLYDLITEKTYSHRDGNEIFNRGLYVDLAPWNSHWFEFKSL